MTQNKSINNEKAQIFSNDSGADFLEMSESEMEEIIRPFIVREIKDSAEWRALTWPVYKKVSKDAIKRLFYKRHKNTTCRKESSVAERYGKIWLDRGFNAQGPNGVEMLVKWRNRHLLINSAGLRRLYIARLMRLIERVQPRKVLELGSGNGEKLLILACRFPEIEFHSVELSSGGIAVARSVQDMEQLPQDLVSFSPEPLKDLTAHRHIDFYNGSAQNIPYDDNSIDLVFTSLAIEQMNPIKDEVLAELGRVCKQHASFFEAFQEFNKGIIQRMYNYAENYFHGGMDDVSKVGFRDVVTYKDLPQKLWINSVHILASK